MMKIPALIKAMNGVDRMRWNGVTGEIMKKLVLGLLFALAPMLSAQAPPNQEVVLSASAGSKLGIALPYPKISGLPEATVTTEFHQVLIKDLEEAGPFAVIQKGLPGGTDAASYKAWADTGTEWLLTTTINRGAGADLEVMIQVVDVMAGQGKNVKAVMSKRYTGKDGALRRIAHKISDDLMARLTGDAGAASTRVVFVKEAGRGIKEIYQVDRDGANAFPLTNFKSLTISPSIAPDGRLAYVTYKGGAPEIWGQRVPGGPQVKLYPPSGKAEGHCFCPSWSPDGKRLALVQSDRRGNTDIVMLDVATGRVRRLTDSNCINTDPSWNPAGTQLAFTSDREGGPQVFLMGDDGSNVRRLTQEGTYNGSPAWSPSGSMIAYVSRFEGKFDLFVYKLGEGKSYQITTGVASSESPSWSPDERRIVFSSGSRGGMQLYTTDLSGNTLRKLMNLDGCQSPKWTRSR
jgi:TolB protein